MTTMLETGQWTDADSDDLDNYAALHWNTPLRRDPELYALLAEDREEAPYKSKLRHRNGNPSRPQNCRECRRPLRSRYEKDPHPDAMLHYGRGMCARCYQKDVRSQ